MVFLCTSFLNLQLFEAEHLFDIFQVFAVKIFQPFVGQKAIHTDRQRIFFAYQDTFVMVVTIAYRISVHIEVECQGRVGVEIRPTVFHRHVGHMIAQKTGFIRR